MVFPVCFQLTNSCWGKIPNTDKNKGARAIVISAFVFDALAFFGCLGVGIWLATSGAPPTNYVGYGLIGISGLIGTLYIVGMVKRKIEREEMKVLLPPADLPVNN
jgi:hypothetical protein